MATNTFTNSTEISPTQYSQQNILDRAAPYAHWLLRLSLASVFVYHGLSKLGNVEMFAQMMNLPYGIALLVALAELAGGVGIIVGSFTREWITRLSGLAIIPVMLGAIFMVHWGRWNFVPADSHPMGGMEFQVTLLLIALYFVIRGNKV